MIVLEHPVQLENTYDLTRIGPLEQLLFFDIETTGFSGDSSVLYLIGCTYFRQGSWQMVQYFSDSPQAEAEVLTAFFQLLEEFSILIHFNGDGFDIPYLLKRCRRLGLDYGFDRVVSLDIYRKIRPYKKLLQLDSLKQKALEQFLGVRRTDLYSGGELIEVYYQYLRSRDKELFHLLILHNEDDLKGMPSILPILNYSDFLEGPLEFSGQDSYRLADVSGQIRPYLELNFKSPYSIPVKVSAEHFPADLRIRDRRLTCRICLYEGELKYFYPNYKDYYYLPFEDTAVHKSVGEYVDKSARKKATAANCYTRRQGLFLPQFDELFTPVFRQNRKDTLSYAEFKPELFQDAAQAQSYTRQLLHYLQNGK